MNWIESHRLLSYMEEHHPRQWKWLTDVLFLREGFYNIPRIRRWLFSKEDEGDPGLTTRKWEYRRFFQSILTVFFSYVVLMQILLGI